MGDAALWKSELLRARQWLLSREEERRHGNEQIFTRVNAHMAFKDHQRSLQSEAAASEDEDDDNALDFLRDVDASDMKAFLQAEADKAAAEVPPVETGTPLLSQPSAGDLQPLEMPTNLPSPTLKPKVKPVPMSQLNPKTATSTMASATLGNDAAVHKLMQDLNLALTRHLDTEEKTEESMPPHLLKNVGGSTKSDGVLAGEASGKAEQSKYMHQVSSKSPQNPHKVATPATTKKSDDVAAEMLSWVSGPRNPEVIQRKEKLVTRKRKHPRRFGVSSEEEQRQVLRKVKQITHGSDSESEDDFSSDYSPAEDQEVQEPDEPEVVDLLSDDYLDSDGDNRPVKRTRKRLRRADSAQKKKKARSRKPSVTRKLAQQNSSGTQSGKAQDAQPLVNSSESEVNHKPVADKRQSMSALDDTATMNPNQSIDLLSSGDETGDSDKGSTPEPVERGARSSIDSRVNSTVTGSEACEGSTILRLKVPKNFQHSQVQERGPNKQQQKMPTRVAEASTAFKRCVSAEHDAAFPSKPRSRESVAVERARQNENNDSSTDTQDTIDRRVDDNVDDADLSDTGTIDFEGEDLSLGKDEYAHDKEDMPTSETADSGASMDTDVNPVTKPKELESSITRAAEVQQSGEADEDVSEAETEVLEDDEPDTDDLGLNYSDDSDPEGMSESDKKNTVRGAKGAVDDKRDAAADKKDATGKSGAGGRDDSEKSPNSKGENRAADSSTAGMNQFFDFVPLKLKPNVKSTTSIAPKPLPVHNYAETHVKNGMNNLGKIPAEPKKVSAVSPPKPSAGSNGLRSSKKPIATTATRKGKYLHTRRSTKLLDGTPGVKAQPKGRYTMVPTRKPRNDAGQEDDLDDMPLLALAKRKKESGGTSNAKCLSYAGAKKTEDAPTYAAETPRIVAKSRYSNGGINSSTPAPPDPPATSNGQHSQLNDKPASREPQISIYDALHVEGQESASDIREGAGYKRLSRFKKMQEEAARNGSTPKVRRFADTDWDQIPIPKKKKQVPQVEPAQNVPWKTSNANDHGSRNATEKIQNKRRKQNTGSFNKNSGPSYYGPQASQSGADKYESPSRGRRGRENNHSNRNDDRRRKRSLSPLPRDRDRYKRDGNFRDDRRRRGSSRSRSRSRSLSPRGRDYGSSHYHRRSRSRSRSRERSSERDHRRTERSGSNGRDRDTNASRKSKSPKSCEASSKKDASTKIDAPELGEINQNGRAGSVDRSPEKQKTSRYTEAPPSPGALATFEDDGDNMFISDSDDDDNVIKEVEDIRCNLESVPVDEALMLKRVYVTGVNPTVCAEQIEEDFVRFGVAVDRDTGFPAIDIFPCQRSHLGRGDACVTFETERGALEAVEELNSKNVKNSMIRVRQMDVHTQRILTVQFEMIRDTWKCTDPLCRADVSVWNAKCDKCGRKRVYAPSNFVIGVESWLCSLCFTANESFATGCHGCMESLPEVDRSTFYSA